MTATKELIPADLITTLGDEEEIKELTKASNYLPSLRVFDGSANPVKAGKMPTGEIAISLGQEKYLRLGKEVSVLNLGYRPRAAIFQGKAKPIDFFDEKSEAFQEVHACAMAGKKGYQAGLEYLVYVPAAKKFCCFFLGNKSGRYVSDNMKALKGKAATIRSRFVERPDNSWWCAEILPCNTPFELPSRDEMIKANQLFRSSAVSQEEETTDEETGRER